MNLHKDIHPHLHVLDFGLVDSRLHRQIDILVHNQRFQSHLEDQTVLQLRELNRSTKDIQWICLERFVQEYHCPFDSSLSHQIRIPLQLLRKRHQKLPWLLLQQLLLCRMTRWLLIFRNDLDQILQ